MELKLLEAAALPPQAAILTRAAAPPDDNPPEESAFETGNGDGTQTRVQVNREIRDLVERGGLAASVADDLIDRGVSVEEARGQILDLVLAQPRPADQIRTVSAIRQNGRSGDDPEVVMERCVEALFTRQVPGHKPSEEARPYIGYSLPEMARALAVARGDTRAAHMPLSSFMARATHTTSDFPVLLQGTGNRILLEAFERSASAIRMLARQITNPDFRTRTVAKIGEMPRLTKVGEGGEILSVTRAEAKEAWRLETYAQMISITRQAIVNDDLGAFTDTLNAMAQAAADTEAWLLVELLTANTGAGPVLDDGTALFHADHGNLDSSGAAPDADELSAARLAMRKQTGVGGALITVTPRYLVVPPDLETTAEALLATIQPTTVEEVNVFSGKLELVVEPRLSDAAAWYVFADPARAPVLEYGYLAQAPGPQLETQQGWETLGTSFRCFLDFGAGVIDHRGAYRNPGQ